MPEKVILIAAVTVDGYIARHSSEETNWTKDLSLFKKQTMSSVVIVGSTTYKILKSELPGRTIIKVNRNSNPKKIIESVDHKKCFIIGGGKTYSRFADYLTHLFITPHPYVFSSGVLLFEDKINELKLKFKKLVIVDKKNGIFQYQYKIKKE